MGVIFKINLNCDSDISVYMMIDI